jgi:hypothetical protein
VLLKNQAFWYVTPCPLVNSYRRSEGHYSQAVALLGLRDPEEEEGKKFRKKLENRLPVDTV